MRSKPIACFLGIAILTIASISGGVIHHAFLTAWYSAQGGELLENYVLREAILSGDIATSVHCLTEIIVSDQYLLKSAPAYLINPEQRDHVLAITKSTISHLDQIPREVAQENCSKLRTTLLTNTDQEM